MTNAYSYTRFSTPEQARGDSARRQTELAEQYAAAHGLDLDAKLTFNDLGKSAFRGSNVETGHLAEFLAAVNTGLVPAGSTLLVESLDRISRLSARKALRVLEQICDAGITVVTLIDGRVYTAEALDSDPLALMMSLLILIRSHEESVTKSSRLLASWEHKRQIAGTTPMTSLGPSWLRLVNGHWEIIEERAAVVRRIFEMAAAGVGQHSIAEWLNEEHVPVFGRGKHWHRSFIAKLLGSPAAIGTLVPHTLDYSTGKRVRRPQSPIPGYYPAIVDPGLHAAVTAMLGTKAPLRGRHANTGTVSNILGGLARCPNCGSVMTRVMKGSGPKGGKPVLVCTKARAGAGCPYHSVPYEPLERALVRQVDRLVTEAPRNGEAEHRADDLQVELWATLDERDHLIDAIASGQLANTPALATRIAETETELARLRHDLTAALAEAAASRGPLVAQRLAELHDALRAEPLDRQRANALLRSLLTGVTVDWPDHTLVLAWRHGGETELSYGWPPLQPTELDEVQNAQL